MNPTPKFIYPPNPETWDTSFLNPHAEFEANVKRVAYSIMLFLATYFVLLLATAFVCYVCILSAIFVIEHLYHIIFVLFALGFVIFGVMLFVFMLKFLFIKNRKTEEIQVEIFAKDQPHLFAFIQKVAEDTFNPMPKHIYLTRGVNASVSADSQLLSFLFSSPKNLTIGLGIVNTLNISEFKAVLGHEFGHFSQKSTHFGRYIYAFYLLLYNWIYAEDSWDKVLGKLLYSGLRVIRLTGWLILSTSNRIKRLMAYLFRFVQKSYMSLSREMEYNADKMAVCISGNEASISALRKVEISDMCMHQSFQHAGWAASQQQQLPNLYPYHRFLMKQWADKHEIVTDENGVPKITSQTLIQQSRPNIVYKDQWASHPSNEDRALKMNEVSLVCAIEEASAWTLFENAEALQTEMTNSFFAQFLDVESLPFSPISPSDLSEMVKQDEVKNAYPPAYQGFYDDRGIFEFEVAAVLGEKESLLSAETPHYEVFTVEKTALIRAFFIDAQDAAILAGIANGGIETRLFEYKGRQYAQKEAKTLVEKLKISLETQEKEIRIFDKQAFLFHYYRILEKNWEEASRFLAAYTHFFAWRILWEKMVHFKQDYEENLNVLFAHKPMDTETANTIIRFLFEKEATLTNMLKEIDNEYLILLKEEKDIAVYLQKNLRYFISRENMEGKRIQDFALFVATIHEKCLEEYRQTWRNIMEMQFPIILAEGE